MHSALNYDNETLGLQRAASIVEPEQAAVIAEALGNYSDYLTVNGNPRADSAYRAKRSAQLAEKIAGGFMMIENTFENHLRPGFLAGVDALLVTYSIERALHFETDDAKRFVLRAVQYLLDDDLAILPD